MVELEFKPKHNLALEITSLTSFLPFPGQCEISTSDLRGQRWWQGLFMALKGKTAISNEPVFLKTQRETAGTNSRAAGT